MGIMNHIAPELPADPRILVVQKRSFLDMMVESADKDRFEALMKRDSKAKERYEMAHDENQEAAETVTQELQNLGVRFDVDSRPLDAVDPDYDLVLSVGGDGTFLSVAHAVGTKPMMGINSSRTFSVGRYCGTHVDDFERVIGSVLDGSLKPRPLYRIGMEIDGVMLDPPALNEVLFAHSVPAGTSRYRIAVGGLGERHKSSGVWVATAPGSTGAIHSAGGTPMPTCESGLQFVVREAYSEPGEVPHLLRGIQKSEILLTCLMQDGALFVDGARVVHPVMWGQTVRFVAGHRPLWAYRPSAAFYDS
jgi:NAD+ kinase